MGGTGEVMHWACSAIIAPIFIVIGLLGNALSIAVWRRKKMRSSTGVYLIAQSIADIAVLVLFLLMDSIKWMDPGINLVYAYGVFHSYIGYPFLYLAVICSIWFTVGVTVDRYIMVCVIKHAKGMCTEKRALTGVGIIFALCFVINVPHFSTFRPISDQDRLPNATAFAKTDFGGGTGSDFYEFWIHCMFLVLVPWLTIAIMNGLIVKAIDKSGSKVSDKKSEEARQKQKKSERQITMLLLVVTFTFLILIGIQCIVQCFFMLKPTSVDGETVNEAYAIAKLGIVVNSSINFILYCLTARRFRNELIGILDGTCGIKIGAGYGMFSDTSSSSNKHSSSVV